jgi:hypothetical protein
MLRSAMTRSRKRRKDDAAKQPKINSFFSPVQAPPQAPVQEPAQVHAAPAAANEPMDSEEGAQEGESSLFAVTWLKIVWLQRPPPRSHSHCPSHSRGLPIPGDCPAYVKFSIGPCPKDRPQCNNHPAKCSECQIVV